MDVLYAQLHRWMAEPFVWGETDCLMSLANYLVAAGYDDPGADLRGLYSDAVSCHKLTGFLRDPLAVVKPRFEAVGLVPTDTPKRGDVGLLRIVSEGKQVVAGGVCTGDNWAVKGEHRLTIGKPLEIIAAWSIDAK